MSLKYEPSSEPLDACPQDDRGAWYQGAGQGGRLISVFEEWCWFDSQGWCCYASLTSLLISDDTREAHSFLESQY